MDPHSAAITGFASSTAPYTSQLLTHYAELQNRPTAAQRAALAAANPCPPERAALVALTDDDPRTLTELIEANPALRGVLDWPGLLDPLTPLRPRHYSISSSPATDPGHVDLMVSLLDAPARPLLLRLRRPRPDYLHAEELRAADTVGAVSIRPAFSAGPDGRFVQHRIAAEGEEVWKPLAEGARVHVCGDGSRMAPGVRDAFRTLYRDHTPDADEAAAETWLNELMTNGRYVEDVYAAS